MSPFISYFSIICLSTILSIIASIKIEEQIQIIFADFKDAIKRGDNEKISELLQKYKEFDLANKIDPISK